MVLEKDLKLKMAGKCLKKEEEREGKNCLFRARELKCENMSSSTLFQIVIWKSVVSGVIDNNGEFYNLKS